MTTPEKTSPPSNGEIEDLAQEMIELKGKIADKLAQVSTETAPLVKQLKDLTDRAEKWLRQYGSAHAEKSRLLHGLTFEILGTFGQSTSIDNAAVEIFRLALVKAGKSQLLRKIFKKVVRWELLANWGEVLKAEKLPAKLTALYANCQVTKDRAPTITPRERAKAASA